RVGALAGAARDSPPLAARRGRRRAQSRRRRGARRGAPVDPRRPLGDARVRGDGGQGVARDARSAPSARRARHRDARRAARARSRASGRAVRGGAVGRSHPRAGRGARRGPRRHRSRRRDPDRRLPLSDRRGLQGDPRRAPALRALASPRHGWYRTAAMRAGRAARWAAGVVLGTALFARADERPPAEVRVLSGMGPQAATTVTLRAEPETRIEDRTPGAKPAAGPRGPASVGETFTGELTLFLDGYRVPRPAAIDVADAVVSTVRLFPEPGGTTVSIFVRQPVTYSVSRPSGIGEIAIELRSRTRPIGIAGVTSRGATRAVRPKTKGRPSEVSVDAESLSYERETNTLVARGGVTL